MLPEWTYWHNDIMATEQHENNDMKKKKLIFSFHIYVDFHIAEKSDSAVMSTCCCPGPRLASETFKTWIMFKKAIQSFLKIFISSLFFFTRSFQGNLCACFFSSFPFHWPLCAIPWKSYKTKKGNNFI